VIGLGTGTLSAYGRLAITIVLEINPLVLRLAHTEFFFLGDCKAKLDVAMGDARLSLRTEAPREFRRAGVDASRRFNSRPFANARSDVGLFPSTFALTEFSAVHISNRYLNLEPVLPVTAATGNSHAW